MKLAVVGAGISGIMAAHELAKCHSVDVFEAGSYPGGHTDTHSIQVGDQQFAVDSGFIVYNQEHYTGFCRFLDELGVAGRDSEMSFSVSNTRSGLEYNATDLNRLFCQRRNMVRPRFYKMLWDILRFYRQAPALLKQADDNFTLGEYLEQNNYSQTFIDDHLIPMACALWSGPSVKIQSFPARYFVQFMHNHRMLDVNNRPQWRTVAGGSQRYVDAWMARFPGRLFCDAAVQSIEQTDSGMRLLAGGEWQTYDQVFIACHSDQALAMLAEPTAEETSVLGAIAYQQNHMQLHCDTSLLPDSKAAWASWNARVCPELSNQCTVSYDMNILQGIDAPLEFIVSLNSSQWVDPGCVFAERQYQHPVYNADTLAAQKRWHEINGVRGIYYCGAYWGWGFHEDGVNSALRAVSLFQEHAGEKSSAERSHVA